MRGTRVMALCGVAISGVSLLAVVAWGFAGTGVTSTSPGAIPTPTGTPSPFDLCPRAAVCRFASTVDRLLRARDVDSVRSAWLGRTEICSGQGSGAIAHPPGVCFGVRRGELRFGYDFPIGGPVPAIVSGHDLESRLGALISQALKGQQDGHGSGAFRLRSIGCAVDGCRDRAVIVFSGIYQRGRAAQRGVLALFVSTTGGATEMRVYSGREIPDARNAPAAVFDGGEVEDDFLRPFKTFYRWAR